MASSLCLCVSNVPLPVSQKDTCHWSHGPSTTGDLEALNDICDARSPEKVTLAGSGHENMVSFWVPPVHPLRGQGSLWFRRLPGELVSLEISFGGNVQSSR